MANYKHLTQSDRVLIESSLNQGLSLRSIALSLDKLTSTISNEVNPSVDKLMDICNVLQITPEQLLTGKGIEDEEEIATAMPESRFTPQDIRMVEDYHGLKEEQQKRLMAYMEALKKIESLEEM